ncbi:MAG: DUF1836 domain-containing protein [Lachnospiraceae bacterium]
MKIESERLLESILESISRIDYVKSGEIPGIDLYMDQVTTFMEEHLQHAKRYPEDKILTKTMINNYAKNHLLPPPEKKKYSKEHMLVLIYIYYFKNILSIGDIQSLLTPLTDRYFRNDGDLNMECIYEEVFSLEKEQIELLKQEMIRDFERSHQIFADAEEEDRKFLQLFSFICVLSFDVYVKKQVIEKLIDEIPKPIDEKHKK